MAPRSAGSVSSYGQSSEGSSAGGGSEISIGVNRGDDGTGELLTRGKRSRKEAFFAVMYFSFEDRFLETDWRFLLLSTLYIWVQMLNLIFGPNFFAWDIDWDGNNWWRFYKRLLLSNAAVERGWGLYVGVVLVFVIVSLLLSAIPMWLDYFLKSRIKLRWDWPGQLLRVSLSVFRAFNISFISLLTVSFTCNNDSGRTMFYFPDRGCLVMPQVILFVVCLVVEVFLLYLNLLAVLVESGDTNYYSKNFFSTSVGSYMMRLNLVLMALPLVPMALQLFPKWQAFFYFVLTSYHLYITIRRAPMHRTWLNCVNAFLALFPWWAASLAFIGVFYHEYWPHLTTAFLAGMFPLGFACAGIAYWRLRFIWGVAERFKGWTPKTPRREVYRFWDEYEVEMVARVCRKTVKTDQLDIIPDPYYTSLADNVLQAGLIQFPDSAFLNIVYASLQARVLNDTSGGVPQLQKAKKCIDLSWVQRFQVYVREQEKLAQKGRDADQSVTFDAATWSEFFANYKSAIKCHRNALTTLKAFWHLLLRSDVSMVALVRSFLNIPASTDAAEHSYKVLMERYPNNPRVLRAYARFLQQVKNDPHGSTRFAAMANKVEQQQEEALRETVFSQLIDRKYLDEKSTKTMAMMDETLDAVIMINGEGMIQHINHPALKLFGYRKGELEGSNLNQLMPQPFSRQHDSVAVEEQMPSPGVMDIWLALVSMVMDPGLAFLRNYMTTRQVRILDSTREVVGLHKERHVFPIDLCVTPIMMGAAECFLGVIKPLPDNSALATAYCTSAGTVVCISRGFSNLLAHQSADIIGRSFVELTATPEKGNQIIASVSAGDPDGLPQDCGKLTFTHKFGEEISMDVVGRLAGTGNVAICVLDMSNKSNAFTGLVTVSKATGRMVYVNTSFCEFLGIPADQLIKMRLHEIIIEPFSMLHQHWVKGRDLSRAPSLKCRAGRAVEFKHGSSGKAVTAILEISERSTDQGNVFNVKVAPIEASVDKEWNRISLTVAQDGTIVSHTGKLALFGLEKEVLVGRGLDALLDVYRKEGEELAATHAKLLQDLHDRPRTLRMAVAPRGKRTVPAVLEVVLPGEETQEAPTTMHLYRADCLEGIIELDAACKMKKVNKEAALQFGIPASSLVGEHIQKVLPKICPGGRTTELLAAHGQRGGSKQKVGAPQPAESVHPDKHALHVSLQAAESTERPGRYLVRIIVPKPVSAYSSVNRPGAGAPLAPIGMALSHVPTQPGIAGSLRNLFTAGAAASRSGTGGACPFHVNAEAPSPALPSLPSFAPTPGLSARPSAAGEGAPSLRAVTASGCPFSFGSKAGGSREASVAAPQSSRPATGSTGCPMKLNMEEVLSTLSFPPTSRFAIAKAHLEERARRASAQAESADTAAAAALAAAAVAAAVAANDQAPQDPGEANGSRGPSAAGGFQVPLSNAARVGGELEQGQAVPQEATAVAGGAFEMAEPRYPAPGLSETGAPTQGRSAVQSMSASEEEEGEGGAEDEMPPEVLAAKMSGVRAWLDATAALQQEQAGPTGSDTGGLDRTGTAVLELPGVSETGLLAAHQEPGGLLDEPSAVPGEPGQPSQPADQATVDSSSMGESDTGSLAAGDAEDDGAQYSRLRRFKKAYKLLNSAGARQAINRLRIHIRLVLLVIVAAHVAFFAAALITVNSSLGFVQNIDKAGTGARNAVSVCTDFLTLQAAAQEVKLYGHTVIFPNTTSIVNEIVPKVLELEKTQHEIYFTKGSAAAATTAAYDTTMLNVSVYLDVQPHPFSVETPMSLWDSVQRLINSAKDIAAMSMQQLFDLNATFAYRFIMDNSPEGISQALLKIVDMETWLAVDKLNQVGRVTWVFLGIEAGLIIPLCAIYLIRLLYQVAIERFNLFSIFLFIPRPAVLALARAEVVVDEMDDSEDDEEEMGAGVELAAASGAISTAVSQKVLAQKAAQNRLAISQRSMIKLMFPFGIWLAVVGILWGVQYELINSSKDRVMALDLSERSFAYFSRVLYFQTGLWYAATPLSGSETSETLHLRSKLIDTANRAKFYYELGLYGQDNPDKPLNQTYNTASKNYPGLHFSGTMFTSMPRNELLYKEGCLRADHSTCFPKSSSFYWTTNMGLNTLMYYFLELAIYFANTNSSAIGINNPIVQYGLSAAPDADGAWIRSNQIFMYVANFDIVRAIQGVMLAVALVWPLAYLYFLAVPYVRLTLLESRRVAEVLSYLPQGVDVAALIEIANSNLSPKVPAAIDTRAKGLAKRASLQSADAEIQ